MPRYLITCACAFFPAITAFAISRNVGSGPVSIGTAITLLLCVMAANIANGILLRPFVNLIAEKLRMTARKKRE